jgi:hypothetical protein
MRKRCLSRSAWSLCLFALLGVLTLTAPASARQLTLSRRALHQAIKASPSQEDVGRAVIKALGALVSHEASKPQPGDDFGQMIARGLARQLRDELIDSALQDLAPTSKAVERAAVRGLVVLALDGKLVRDRDRIVAHLRKTNPDLADVVEISEFLIRLSQAAEQSRR